VIDEAGGARVVEAGGQRAGQTQAVIDRAEEERAAVAGERAAGAFNDDFAGAEVGKEERFGITVCHAGTGSQSRAQPIDNIDPNALFTALSNSTVIDPG
jgi:hypothetical protein